MQTDHDKIVQQIEKKMAGASMHKSQQEKKQQIFEYGKNDSQFQNFEEFNSGSNLNHRLVISTTQAQKSLQQIYNFYVNTYIQPRVHFDTFDMVNQRRLNFQPFILFMKNFRLLKIIFGLDKVKLMFKKYANFGQYLTLQNFIFLINQLSHQEQAKNFFNLQQPQHKSAFDLQKIEDIQKQQIYNYLNLQNPDKFRLNFKGVFQPFFCKQKIKTKKIKYTYRKFSQPELMKKSQPQNRNKTQQKQLYVVKNKDIQIQQNQSPFNQVKSIVVSWESLRSQSLANLQKTSQDIIKKKYIKNDPNDDQYLKQYEGKQEEQRRRLEKRIKQLTDEQANKNKLLLAKLEQRTSGPKSLVMNNKKIK